MRQIFLLSTLLLITLSSFAQKGEQRPNRQEMEAAKVKFFNNQLQLSETEQAIFWPAFNKHTEELKALRKEGKRPRMELMSDAEAEDYIDNYFVMEDKKLTIRKSLYDTLKGKINIRKIAALPQVEQKFKRHLLQKVRQQRQGGGGKSEGGKGRRF